MQPQPAKRNMLKPFFAHRTVLASMLALASVAHPAVLHASTVAADVPDSLKDFLTPDQFRTYLPLVIAVFAAVFILLIIWRPGRKPKQKENELAHPGTAKAASAAKTSATKTPSAAAPVLPPAAGRIEADWLKPVEVEPPAPVPAPVVEIPRQAVPAPPPAPVAEIPKPAAPIPPPSPAPPQVIAPPPPPPVAIQLPVEPLRPAVPVPISAPVSVAPPAPAEAPAVDAGKLVAWVSKLRGDDQDGSHRTTMLRTLKNDLGSALQILRAPLELHEEESVDADEDTTYATREAQDYLAQYGGELVVWGTVSAPSKVLKLRFTTGINGTSQEKRFRLDEFDHIKDSGPLASATIAAVAEQLAQPAQNLGSYSPAEALLVTAKLRTLVEHPPAALAAGDRGLLVRYYADAERAAAEQQGDWQALARAIAAYREALSVCTRDKGALEWARTQASLGSAFHLLSERESGKESLTAAAHAYREALTELTRQISPSEWADLQSRLGKSLLKLGERERSLELLEASVAANREALKELTHDKAPQEWALTECNLGHALLGLSELEGGTKRLDAAIQAYREALKELTHEQTPYQWARAQNNLAALSMRWASARAEPRNYSERFLPTPKPSRNSARLPLRSIGPRLTAVWEMFSNCSVSGKIRHAILKPPSMPIRKLSRWKHGKKCRSIGRTPR